MLLDGLTVMQNLAMPFTLDIEPPPDDVCERVAELAQEVGLPPSEWQKPVAALDTGSRARVRLARALALDPAVLLLEHATAVVRPSMSGRWASRSGLSPDAAASRLSP